MDVKLLESCLEEEFNSSDEDEELKRACVVVDQEADKENEQQQQKHKTVEKYLESIPIDKQQATSHLRSQYRDEVKKIKVINASRDQKILK